MKKPCYSIFEIIFINFFPDNQEYYICSKLEIVIFGKNLKLIGTFIFILFILLFWSCESIVQEKEIAASAIINLADSISSIQPQTADSMYRIMLNDSSPDNLWGYTQALIGLAMLYNDRAHYDSCKIMLGRAEQTLENIDDTIVFTKFHLAKGYLNNSIGNYEEAERHYTEGLRLAKLSGNAENQHAFRLNLGQVNLETGKYAQAAKILTEELKFADSSGNEFNQSLALKSLAKVAHSANNLPDAIALSKRSLQILKRIRVSDEYSSQLMNLGIYFKDAGMNDSAMAAYREAFRLIAERGDSLGMIRVRFNMGNVLKNQKKYDEAEYEMKQIMRFCKSHNITEGQIFAMTALSKIYKETGRLQQSVASVDSALALARKQNLVTVFSRLYNNQHEVLAALGRYQEAYESSLKSHLIADSLLNIEKQKEILLLNTRYETGKKEAENLVLQKDVEIRKSHFRFLMLASVLGSISLLIFIYLLIVRQKQLKQQKLLSEEKANKAELENKNKEIELENARIEKQLKEQELVYQSLVQADLVLVNRSVREKLTHFRLAISRKKDQDDFQQTLDSLTRDASRDPLAEFEMLFRQLHVSFYEKLLSLAPDLSKSELQVCAMLRLNLSSKDIARLTNLNLTTIEITRHHIRKKLNLEQTDTLNTFLIAI